MFEYFKQAKRFEIKALARLNEMGALERLYPNPRPGFSESLKRKAEADGLAVIAEYKRASPSQGDIALSVPPALAAQGYAASGAAALSVLTEKSKFKGKLGFLEKIRAGFESGTQIPLLRKDFIFHPLQVRATALTPASALLLIVKLSPSAATLRELRLLAQGFGLEAVVEILDETDLALARESGAEIIQVNARDFSDLSVDLNRSLALACRRREGEIWIAASGVSKPDDLKRVRAAGFTAALVGTALMRGGDPAGALRRLTSKLGDGENP
ncbi:indole-3-glycerol-phosphate synthase [Deltaproteobacteria bacterium OttesenSCG-928-K17]|nr:indole-3-glycerol-phosphate synthase [Deltaproteobacteria bacterium OttesenSCG-928-K17]